MISSVLAHRLGKAVVFGLPLVYFLVFEPACRVSTRFVLIRLFKTAFQMCIRLNLSISMNFHRSTPQSILLLPCALFSFFPCRKDPDHRRQYSHPCKYGSKCRDLADASHCRRFTHPRSKDELKVAAVVVSKAEHPRSDSDADSSAREDDKSHRDKASHHSRRPADVEDADSSALEDDDEGEAERRRRVNSKRHKDLAGAHAPASKRSKADAADADDVDSSAEEDNAKGGSHSPRAHTHHTSPRPGGSKKVAAVAGLRVVFTVSQSSACADQTLIFIVKVTLVHPGHFCGWAAERCRVPCLCGRRYCKV